MAQWWNGRAGETRDFVERFRGLRGAAGSALIGNCHPRAKMGRLAALGVFHREPSGLSRFHNRRAGRQQRPRASRFRGSGALAVSCGFSRTSCGHPGRYSSRKKSLAVEKMAPLVCHTSCII